VVYLFKQAGEIAGYIKKQSNVTVITHRDADGLTAGSIACKALEREGIEFEIAVLKQLDEKYIAEIPRTPDMLYWFTDLGSGFLELLNDLNAVVTDHHELHYGDVKLTVNERSDLLALGSALETKQNEFKYLLNPHIFGRDGSVDLSGSGAAYFVAKEMNAKNIDLSALAVVGAVGDLQDMLNGKLVGTNRQVLEDAESAGVIKSQLDIRFFGRETRPLHNFLMYANDPQLPVLAKDEDACFKFLKDIGIAARDGEHYRRWVDLSDQERKIIISELTLLLVNNGVSTRDSERLIGEVYVLPKEEIRSELHDAKEFATILNSCGRYGASDIGIKVCLGNRKDALRSARKFLKGHRRNLVDKLKVVSEIGISRMNKLQYFNAADRINENVIGVVTGMVVSSGEIDSSKPLLGLALCDDGINIKISARAARSLANSNLNLSTIMRTAAEKVGGRGGGHNIAAGAEIPVGREQQFLEIADDLLIKTG
jgi:RecJ-like exonuclease